METLRREDKRYFRKALYSALRVFARSNSYYAVEAFHSTPVPKGMGVELLRVRRDIEGYLTVIFGDIDHPVVLSQKEFAEHFASHSDEITKEDLNAQRLEKSRAVISHLYQMLDLY